MMRAMPFCLLPVVAFVALLAGCERKASDEMDFGTVKNSVYRNNYLGFSMTFPTNWSVQDQKSQRQLTTAGGALVAGDDKNIKAQVKAGQLQSVNLFAIFEYPRGSPVPHNPAILAVAERVRQLPGIQKGKDYLFHARRFLESGQLKVSFPKEIYTERLDGVDFDVMEMEMESLGATVREKFYATIRSGYALNFILVYTNDEEESLERKALDTVAFK